MDWWLWNLQTFVKYGSIEHYERNILRNNTDASIHENTLNGIWFNVAIIVGIGYLLGSYDIFNIFFANSLIMSDIKSDFKT